MNQLHAALAILTTLVVHVSAGTNTAYWQHAAELLKAGDHAAALNETERLLVQRPGDIVLLRVKGVCLIRIGDADAAVPVLQGALLKDPDSVSCRFYLAQALALQGNIVEAIQRLREVCRIAPDSTYATQATGILPRLENLRLTEEILPAAQRWSGSLRAGVEYDDNVPQRSYHDTDASPINSFRLISSVYAEGRLLDEKLDQAPLTLGAGYAFYQSLHERHPLNHYNLTSHDGNIFLRKGGTILGLPFQARLDGNYVSSTLGGHAYSDSFSVSPSFEIQWADWAVLAPRYSVSWNRFANDSDTPSLYSRDGTEQTAGFSQSFSAFDNRLVWGIDYNYSWNRAVGQEYNSDSHRAAAFASVSLPWKMRLSTRFQYSSEDYPDFAPSPIRLDDVYSVSASVSRPLWSENVIMEVGYLYTLSSSQRDFGEFRRTILSLAVSWFF